MDEDFELIVPIDPKPGEDEGDVLIRYCKEQGILTGDDPDNLLINWDRAAELDENFVKFFKVLNEADTLFVLQNLEDDGLVYSTVDKTGNIVYGLTPEGKQHVEELSEDN
jgi:hypothetical protein